MHPLIYTMTSNGTLASLGAAAVSILTLAATRLLDRYLPAQHNTAPPTQIITPVDQPVEDEQS
jgi:hypothetical protein